MNPKQRILWLLATMTLLSCGRSHSTAALPEALARALAAKPHRLAVVFWPQLSGCSACDQLITHVITEWQSEPHSEIVVVSVIPNSAASRARGLPGDLVRLDDENYARHTGSAPLPRVEIRGADGSLLMSRSVPNYGSQAELLTEEMLAARSFTAPVVIASRRQP